MSVAALLGISGSSLARSCRLRGIPLPDRGYWQRVKAGRALARLPLEPVETELPMPWACTPEVEQLLAELGMPRLVPAACVAESGHVVVETPAMRATTVDIAKTPANGAPIAVAAIPKSLPQAVALDLWQRDDVPISLAKAWLAQERDFAGLDRLCVRVEDIARMQPVAVRNVMQTWVAVVREQMDAARPISGFIGLCNRLAEGCEVRAWWQGCRP